MNKFLLSSIKTVSQEISNGKILPSELTKASLELASLTKELNSFITITSNAAKQSSAECDNEQENGNPKGPLHGIPVAIKDNFCTKDTPTTCASLMLANFVPSYNATVYQKLKDAGAILIGKTNLDQFAMGSGTVDSYFGPSKNLWGSKLMDYYDIEDYFEDANVDKNVFDGDSDWFIAGGSSGGSALSVASGVCFAALGSDTGGSTRNPASLCGVVGLKPSYGLVSRHGLIPLVNSMDVPGIITRTVEDAALILSIIAGHDSLDSTTVKDTSKCFGISSPLDVSGIRIGVPKEYCCPDLSKEVDDCWIEISEVLEEAGARIIPVSLPHTEYSISCYSILNHCEVASNMAKYDGIEYGYRPKGNFSLTELYAKTRGEGFNEVVRSRILAGNYFLLAENYDDFFVRAMKIRRLIAQDFDYLWQSGVDLLLTPTTLTDAPTYKKFTSLDNRTQCSVQDFCTQPANMAGIPAISLPIKLSKKGLPLSLQLMAPNFCEERILSVAKWIEDVVKFPKLKLKDEVLLSSCN